MRLIVDAENLEFNTRTGAPLAEGGSLGRERFLDYLSFRLVDSPSVNRDDCLTCAPPAGTLRRGGPAIPGHFSGCARPGCRRACRLAVDGRPTHAHWKRRRPRRSATRRRPRPSEPPARHARHDARRSDRRVRRGTSRRRPSIALAREGVLFEQAVSPAPLTLPAHSRSSPASFRPRTAFATTAASSSTEQTTLAERLKARGFGPAASSAPTCSIEVGHRQGFDTYFDDFDLE